MIQQQLCFDVNEPMGIVRNNGRPDNAQFMPFILHREMMSRRKFIFAATHDGPLPSAIAVPTTKCLPHSQKLSHQNIVVMQQNLVCKRGVARLTTKM